MSARNIDNYLKYIFTDFTYTSKLFSALGIPISNRIPFMDIASTVIYKYYDINKNNIIYKIANEGADSCYDLLNLIIYTFSKINNQNDLSQASGEILKEEKTSDIDNKACVFAICFLVVYDNTFSLHN